MLRARILACIALLSAFLPIGTAKKQNSSSPVLHRVTTTAVEAINLNPSLSGDGQKIAFESSADLIQVGNPPGFHALLATVESAAVTFAELGKTRLVSPGISQDGSILVFSSSEDLSSQNQDRNSEIFLWSRGILRQLTKTLPGSVTTRLVDGNFEPSISDDGRVMFFSSNRDLVGRNPDYNFEIFSLDSSTNRVVQITDTAGGLGAREPHVSGDGSRVVYLSYSGGGKTLLLYSLDSATTQMLAADVQGLSLSSGRLISDDGFRIVYSLELAPHQTEVYLFDTLSGSARQITQLGERVSEVPLNPTISGDGKRIAFATRRRVLERGDGSVELYVFDIPSGQFSQVTNAPSAATAEVVSSLSDDGSLVAFNFPRVVVEPDVEPDYANNSELFLASLPSRLPFGPLTTLNGASLGNEAVPPPLARGGIVIARGFSLASLVQHGRVRSDGSFPLSLGGTSVSVGHLRAELLYVSPVEVHFVVPTESQTGLVDVVVTNADGYQSRTTVQVADVGPGIFTTSGQGSGPAVVLDSDLLVAGPFDPTSGQLRLSVFATGIRNAANVSCLIAGQAVTTEAIMPSPDLPGLDEIHILIPADLRGAGVVPLSIFADSLVSNTVSLTLAGSALRDIVVNEILADPPDGLPGDANLDGTRSASADEFIELVNSTTRDLDISSFQLETQPLNSTVAIVRHRFPPSTIFPAGTAIIIFGGGSFDASNPAFAGAKVFKASSGSLSLLNSGGVVTVRDAAGKIITSVQFGNSLEAPADENQSLTRFPDIFGNLTLHRLTSSGSQRAFSPGTRANGEPFLPVQPGPTPIPTPLPSPSVTPTPEPTPTPSPSPTPTGSTIVISQIFGGGGNSGAPFRNDFIELLNTSNLPVDLSGWSIQYASATSATWAVTNLTARVLLPGQYYLVQLASGGTNGQMLPPAEAVGSTNLAATAGKVALVNSPTALAGLCPTDSAIVDLVGYGSSTSCAEGRPSVAPGNALAILRLEGGCLDTQDNGNDFVTASPNPRNSASAAREC